MIIQKNPRNEINKTTTTTKDNNNEIITKIIFVKYLQYVYIGKLKTVGKSGLWEHKIR